MIMLPLPRLALLLLLAVTPPLVQAQEPAPDPLRTRPDPALSEDQIRELVHQVVEKDLDNNKHERDYTYVEREEEHRLNGKGEVKSTESNTFEVMMLYGEQMRRKIAHNDQPLSEKEAAKEEEKIQKATEKRKNESEEQKQKRLKKEEKDGEESRAFVKEINDAYHFSHVANETIDGRETYVIDAEPRQGYEAHMKEAKILPKFRFRAWLAKDESQWVKLDAEVIDTVSFGWFLARLHKGTRLLIEQTRVNDEVWLPKHVAVKIDVRVALLKNYNIAADVTYRDYKKFRSESKIVGVGEVQDK